MADFIMKLPTEVIKEFESIYKNTEKIFGGMTRAGAEVVLENVKANVPPSLKNSDFMEDIRLTKTYKTPSDDGINTKVVIDDYFFNKDEEITAAPVIANLFEYGSSKRGGKYKKPPKQPFLRKSFNDPRIEKAMYKAQKELSGGLLDE